MQMGIYALKEMHTFVPTEIHALLALSAEDAPSLVERLGQCGPTALVFLGVLLVLLKLGNFRGTLQPNICVAWPSNFYHLYHIQNR